MPSEVYRNLWVAGVWALSFCQSVCQNSVSLPTVWVRRASASTHLPVEGFPVGQHRVVVRLLKRHASHAHDKLYQALPLLSGESLGRRLGGCTSYLAQTQQFVMCCGADAHWLCKFLVKRCPKWPACHCYIEPNATFTLTFVVLEIVALHEGKEGILHCLTP